jgi:hypothetical protein
VTSRRSAAKRRLVGSPPQWANDAWPRFIELCLSRTVEAFRRLQELRSDTGAWSENRISAVLLGFLHQVCDEEDAPAWFPMRECTVDPPLDELISGAANPNTAKRIDLGLRCFGMKSSTLFGLEAKLLSDAPLRGRSPATLTQAYVEEGMVRFVSGVYGAGAPAGCMLAYLVSGTPRQHLNGVSRQIVASRLPCTRALVPARTKVCQHHYASTHPRMHRGEVVLHHLFLICR